MRGGTKGSKKHGSAPASRKSRVPGPSRLGKAPNVEMLPPGITAGNLANALKVKPDQVMSVATMQMVIDPERQAALDTATAIYNHIDALLGPKEHPKLDGHSTDEMRTMYYSFLEKLSLASKGRKMPGTGTLWSKEKALLERIEARGRARSARHMQEVALGNAAAAALGATLTKMKL